MTQFQAQVPHPLRHALPGFLSGGGVTPPPIRVKLIVFIGERALEGPTMQVERHNIGSSEGLLGQVGQEQFVDEAVSGVADGPLFRLFGCRMGRHYDAAP
jgi:hypothetical protein